MAEKDSEKKIQELQIFEQNMQNLLLQKQAFEIELRETQAAMKELDRSGDEVFKIIGQLMIKTDKKAMKDELEGKKKMIELRIKSFEAQENVFSKKISEMQKGLLK